MNTKTRIAPTTIATFLASLILLAVIALSGCAADANGDAGNKEAANAPKQEDAVSPEEPESDDPEEEEASEEAPEAEDEEDIVDIFAIEDLPTIEEAEEETGILESDAGTKYCDREILVPLSGGTKVEDVDLQLAFCDFIEEDSLSQDMLITGEIDHDELVKGPTGQVIMLVHTADETTVTQAIAALEDTKTLKKAKPNYIMQAL